MKGFKRSGVKSMATFSLDNDSKKVFKMLCDYKGLKLSLVVNDFMDAFINKYGHEHPTIKKRYFNDDEQNQL